MYKNKFKKYISLMLIVAIIASSLVLGCTAFAADLVAINDTNFTDKTFRKIVSDVCDTNDNGYLDEKERSRTVFSLSGYVDDDESIESLKGIEYFTSLTKLYCGGIGLKSLDLSQNIKLTQLTCGGNHLTTLSLENLTELTSLDCSDNNLTAINVSVCPKLQTLRCYANKIERLDVAKNYELTTLQVAQNELTALNLNNNTKLRTLTCSNNHLAELSLANNTALNEVTADDIGDQWITKAAYIKANKIYVDYSFKDGSKLVSSSLDTIIDTGDSVATASAFNGMAFTTSEATSIIDNLVNADKEVLDGFVYKYNVSNAACEDMSVNVVVNRNFYQVNFWLDEQKSDRLQFSLVTDGGSVVAPQIPEAATCKKYVSWSDDFSEIHEDKDIYIIWADDHNIVKNINTNTGEIDVHCTKCDTKTIQFNFLTAYNSTEGSTYYVEIGDQNHDGVINAKDFAIIVKM